MCFKKLFTRPDKPTAHYARKALLFGINDYPGTGSDLNGCVNDVYDVKKKLEESTPKFNIKIFTDAQVTRQVFRFELNEAIYDLIPGDVLVVHYSGHGTYVNDVSGDESDGYDEALYLYDGPLIDDDIRNILEGIPDGATVVMILDCCFSGTITRSLLSNDLDSVSKSLVEKNRFFPNPIVKKSTKSIKVKNKLAKSDDMKWITFSGSGEHQTSADAYINGKYNGAFTYFMLKALRPNITYAQWAHYTSNLFATSNFEQVPQIEGPESLLNNLIFYI